MRRYSYIFMMFAIALILAACGGKETKEDVIHAIEEKMDEVETYHTEAALNIVAYANDEKVGENKGVLKVTMDENTLESSGEVIEGSETIKYYSTKDATYAQVNDGAWEDMTAQEEDFKQTDTNYESIAQIIIDLKDEEDFEMEEGDDTFTFTFQGKSKEVYDALEDPYSLSITGAETEDVEHDVTITVDSETYFIKQLKADLSVEVDHEKLEINVDHTYENINAIDAIEIPQEIIDEAESATNSTFGEDEKEEQEDEATEETEEQKEQEETDANDGALGERVFEAVESGIQIKITYYHQGDKVIKQTAENVVPYEAIGVNTKEEAQAIYDPMSEKFQGIDGVKQEMEYTDTEALETLEIDFENLDYDKAEGLPGMMLDGNAKESGVSMQKSAEMLLNQGFTEVE